MTMTEALSEARAAVLKAVADIAAESGVGLARTGKIVERVGKKRVTVTIMLTRLKDRGLLYQPLDWGSWALTDKGEQLLRLYLSGRRTDE